MTEDGAIMESIETMANIVENTMRETETAENVTDKRGVIRCRLIPNPA